MNLIGSDFHTRFQQIAMLNTETGETLEKRIYHQGKGVEEFYGQLTGPTVVGIESTGYSIWFHELMEEMGIELKVGDSAKIRAQQVRRKKTDPEDARLVLKLLAESRFPEIWVIDAQGRDVRQVLVQRRRLVKTRTGVKNSLQSLALNHRLALGHKLFSQAGREAFRKLKLRPHARQTGQELWEQLDWLQPRIQRLDRIVQQQVRQSATAQLLQSHPGVGPVTALAWTLIIGPAERFAGPAQVASYVGLVPAEYSSGCRRRLGHITKQGPTLLRYQLVEAAHSAARHEPELKRAYKRLLARRGMQKAKTAVARKLCCRLYLMHRQRIDYAEFRRRGLLARSARNNS